MDTRTKIVDRVRAAALANSGATVVSGYFDPMIAAHAERLTQLKRPDVPLLVLIARPPDAILPARARAELVASLTVVDFVCETDDGITPSVHLEEEHHQVLERLIGHVHARQSGAS